MVVQEDFGVEQFMDKYEKGIENNMGESCVDLLSIKDIINMYPHDERGTIEKQLEEEIFNMKLVYGYIKGSDELKESICTVYNLNDYEPAVEKDNVVVTNGAIGANFLTFYTLLNPGDTVIAVEPSYQQLTSVPNVFSGGNVIKYHIDFDQQYQPDIAEFQALVEKHKPKLFVLNNPNNPTGYVWSNSTLQQFVDICRKNDVYIFCDEAYRPLFHSVAEPPRSIVQFGYDKAISTGTMSKAFSLAGVRLGWIVTRDKQLIRDLYSKRDYNTISVSMVDDVLSRFALKNYQRILERNYAICRSNLHIVQQYVQNSNGLISWVKPQAGTTCFLKFNIPQLDTYKLCSVLAEEYSTLLVPGDVFGYPGFVRLGFGNGESDIVHGLQCLQQYLSLQN